MIRMLIVGYCTGLRSEPRLCEDVHLNLAYAGSAGTAGTQGPRSLDVLEEQIRSLSREGIVTLPREERERTIRGTDFHAAATTSRHVLIAAARSTRWD
jgi:hypothetical protein